MSDLGDSEDDYLAAWLADRDPTRDSGSVFSWEGERRSLPLASVPPAPPKMDPDPRFRWYPMGGEFCELVHPAPHVLTKIDSITEVGNFKSLPFSAATPAVSNALNHAAIQLALTVPASVGGPNLDWLVYLANTSWSIIAALLGRPAEVSYPDGSEAATKDVAHALLSRSKCYERARVLGGFERDGLWRWLGATMDRNEGVDRFMRLGLGEDDSRRLMIQAFFTGAGVAVAEYEFFTTPPTQPGGPLMQDAPAHQHRFDYLSPYVMHEIKGAPAVGYRCTRPDCLVVQPWPSAPTHEHRYETAEPTPWVNPDGRKAWRCVAPGCPSFTWG